MTTMMAMMMTNADCISRRSSHAGDYDDEDDAKENDDEDHDAEDLFWTCPLANT